MVRHAALAMVLNCTRSLPQETLPRIETTADLSANRGHSIKVLSGVSKYWSALSRADGTFYKATSGSFPPAIGDIVEHLTL